jgi:hypothetical protein
MGDYCNSRLQVLLRCEAATQNTLAFHRGGINTVCPIPANDPSSYFLRLNVYQVFARLCSKSPRGHFNHGTIENINEHRL